MRLLPMTAAGKNTKTENSPKIFEGYFENVDYYIIKCIRQGFADTRKSERRIENAYTGRVRAAIFTHEPIRFRSRHSSSSLSWNPARVAAAIVSGVGFLGGGNCEGQR